MSSTASSESPPISKKNSDKGSYTISNSHSFFKNKILIVLLTIPVKLKSDDLSSSSSDDEFPISNRFKSVKSSVLNSMSTEAQKSEVRKLEAELEKKKSLKSVTKSLATENYEKKIQELQNKIKDIDDKAQEKLRRAKEIEKLTTTYKNDQAKLKELQKELDRKKLQTDVTKEMRKSEINNLELEIKKHELFKQRVSKIFIDLENAEKVDICFLCDCTGSMTSYINEAKTLMHRLVDKISKRFKNFDLRVSFVGYRDHGDGDGRVVSCEFTDELVDFKSFVNSVSATGGADECEDIFGGLEAALDLNWSNMTRILFHVGDAPCHGKRFHASAGDDYPDGDPRGLNITSLLRKLVDLKIRYYFAEINTSTRKMIDEFNRELNSFGADSINVVNISSVGNMLELVTKAVTESISVTQSLSMRVPVERIKKEEAVRKDALNWSLSNFKKFKSDLLTASYTGTIDEISKTSIHFETSSVEFYLCSTPFAKGATRYAYASMFGSGEKCVAKASMFKDAEVNTLTYNKDVIESQVIAEFLSKEFYKVSRSEKTINFVKVSLACIDGSYYSIEEYIPGTFQKWLNNAGAIDEDIYANTIHAFSHWTYQATGEYLIVTDLQGFIVDGKEFRLTDPAISSIDIERFSSTNLGKKGIKKFFESHQCNHICKALGLIRNKYQTLPDRDVGKLATKLK